MRILLCTPSLDPAYGGPARSVPQLAAALAELGAELGLWSPQPGPDRLPDYTESTYIQRFSGDFTAALGGFGRTDVVHDNGLWLPCHHRVARECGRRGIPRVVSPRGMLEPWALDHKRWKKRLAWHLYQRRDLQSARLLHATSNAELEQFRRLSLNQPAVMLPNGVTFPENRKSEIRHRKSEIRQALFLSRLHPKKGLELLVEVWAQVRPAGWVMRVVGPNEGGYRQKIKNAVDRAGLADSWTFEEMAEGSAKWRCLAEADLFILPSFSENFGIVVAEALVAGVPIITTTGTPWGALPEQRCGWWVESTVKGIEAALRLATQLPSADLDAMGQRGASWARNEFAWPAIARTMMEAYRWAIDGGQLPEGVQFKR